GSPCCRPRGTGPGAGGAYGCVGTVVGCAGFSEPKSGGRSWDPLLEPGSGPDPMEPSGPEGALDVSEVGADGLGGPDSSAPSVTVGTGTVVGGSDEPGGVGSVATGGAGGGGLVSRRGGLVARGCGVLRLGGSGGAGLGLRRVCLGGVRRRPRIGSPRVLLAVALVVPVDLRVIVRAGVGPRLRRGPLL